MDIPLGSEHHAHTHSRRKESIPTWVFCRVRLTNSRKKKLGEPIAVFPKGVMAVECEDEEKKNTKFDFDAVFGNDSTQDQIRGR